jgi:methionyl-tRNA formyltransferase
MACDASVPPLQALVGHGYDVVATVLATLRPPSPAAPPSEIEALARSRSIPVASILRLDKAAVGLIASHRPDVIVVACFPWRLPEPVRTLPPLGCLNVHPSLLPVGRGPEPVFWTLRRGERRTGATVHLMDAGFDTGPILAQIAIATPFGARAGTIERELMALGGELLDETLPKLAAGTIVPVPQDDALSTAAPVPTAVDFVVPTNLPAAWSYAFVRGVAGFAGPLTVLAGSPSRPVRIVDAVDFSPDAEMDEPVMDEGNGQVRVRFRPGVVRFRLR